MELICFWNLIRASIVPEESPPSGQLERLWDQVMELPPEQIRTMDQVLGQLLDRAATSELWLAAMLICGCCQPERFLFFRAWLISCGPEVYEGALADPDTLADLPQVEHPCCGDREELIYLPGEAYHTRTGRQLPRRPALRQIPQPLFRPRHLQLRMPRLWRRYGPLRREDLAHNAAAVTAQC